MKVLLESNLDRKLSTITLDNCSTNDAMIDVLLGRLDSNYLLLVETEWLYRDIFARLKQEDSNYKSVPSNEEWELAKEICGKLKLFYDVTQLFSGTQVPTANIYFNKVCDIHVGLGKWAVSPNPVISSMTYMMKRKFDKYWKEIHGIMGVAAILDPRYKLNGLEYKFARECEDPNECTRKVERIKHACYELLHEYQKNTSNLSNMLVKSTQEVRVNAYEYDDVGYQLYIRQKKKEKCSFVKTKFDHYVEEDVHPLTPDFDILAWWKINGVRFPTLQKIARDIFAIPVSSIASESSFSTIGRIIATHRGSLHEDTIEALMCNQNWLWAEYYKRGGKPDYQTANEDDDAFSELTEE
ncbi:zinc finger BED domain-containing protein RICESLEEPER 2-like [Arachis ipaensis]|uniref:zinc finger BED domain-containing protein RICESLEEPER 2-like n=1 Tax=Arachis ipaensis TaxID=130454 RepID=UPI0007AF7833|nr:zinc finger BED domain-containing protein RICESLEEPER 2-like [Arachis ipaensis]XP_025684648.1 zinc finger BED domain-containing protein RICESLEEPER 2-like [Arachis hypogaea]